MFQASEFADVSGQWGITFNVWRTGNQEDRNHFVHDLCETNDDGVIVKFGEKTLVNYDGQEMVTSVQFINKNIKSKQKVENELVYCKDQKSMEFGKETVKVPEDYLCNIEDSGPDIQQNGASQISSRSLFASHCCCCCCESNFIESCVVLASKTTIQTNWIIDKDLYNFNKALPEEFVNDCIAYATFHNYVMSYNFEGSKLKNEFFFLSHDRMAELTNDNNLDETYNEAKTAKDSYLLEVIKDRTFSPEAKALFNRAEELVVKTMPTRIVYNEEHPEVQILNWDAGWNQICRMIKAYFKDDYKGFLALKKVLAEKIKKQVYEIGLLPKPVDKFTASV